MKLPSPLVPLTLTVDEAARLANTSKGFIRRGVRDGTIPAISQGRLIRILHLPFLKLLGVEPDPNGETAIPDLPAAHTE